MHYHVNQRVGEPFWDACRAMPIPDTLAEKLAMWRRHGRVFRVDDELFIESSWVAVLEGQGFPPERYDPLADALPPEKPARLRSEEHTSELQSLMRTSDAVFCL